MIEIVIGGLEQGCFEPLYYNTTYRNYGETRLERIEMKGVSNMCDVAQRLEDRGIQIGLEEHKHGKRSRKT